MATVLEQRLVKARKAYKCDACEVWRDTGYREEDVDPEDWETIQKAREDNWMILPGTMYLKTTVVDGDGFGHWRERPEMHELCLRNEFYPED